MRNLTKLHSLSNKTTMIFRSRGGNRHYFSFMTTSTPKPRNNKMFRNTIGSTSYFSTSPSVSANMEDPNSLKNLYNTRIDDIQALPEYTAQSNLSQTLHALSTQSSITTALASTPHVSPTTLNDTKFHKFEMTADEIYNTILSSIATFHLHIESRIASLLGHGYYTIGPCGEEMLSSVGCTIENYDAVALHYRHVGVNICRQLHSYEYKMEDVLLDRARGYVVSKEDPVTGGVHCAIGSGYHGGDKNRGRDYVVTSTLASQCPPALGRALGFPLADSLNLDNNADKTKTKKKEKPISFVTLGDGSTHNAHFLSSYNLAKHATYKNIKCPIVFGISDNGLSISYSTEGYVTNSLFKERKENKQQEEEIPIFHADGNNMFDIYSQTKSATSYSRKYSSPSIVLYKDITRRFGHAATDRQNAYLSPESIQAMVDCDVITSNIIEAVTKYNVGSFEEWYDIYKDVGEKTKEAFVLASQEDKIGKREDMLNVVSADQVMVPPLAKDVLVESQKKQKQKKTEETSGKRQKKDVMRKHMNRVIKETLDTYPNTVYIGEDVQHGGYYLVTDQIHNQYPKRIMDVPPDETTLLGLAMGYSQIGLCPIIEIPYAKYLDCGVDMFYEIAINHWLTGGRDKVGMVVRIQGFDRGVFGGNFHTHNMISHVPPGVDLVSFSNGEDYVRGFRNAILQAQNGRIVMTVDSTNLLNLRHLHGKDRGWLTPYPALTSDDESNSSGSVENRDIMGFDDVRRYGTSGKYAIVTYGNGVVTALQARKLLGESGVISHTNDQEDSDLDIIDCPYLSSVPQGLKDIIHEYDGVIFADVCKEGPGSNVLSSFIPALQRDGLLPRRWDFVGAPRTYNPLGRTLTFLNVEDIVSAFERVSSGDNGSFDIHKIVV